MSEAAIKKFKEKLGALEKETGCSIEIVYPKFFEAVEANRLFADWFEPDTVIARAVKGDAVITYDIVGELDAQLVNSSGDIVRTFSGKFTPYNKALILIDDDRNLSTLNDGTDPSGCVLRFAGNNHLRISSSNESVEPIIAPDPSVARGILNRGFLEDLFTATEDANFRDAGRLPIAESRARFDERIEGKVYSLDDVNLVRVPSARFKTQYDFTEDFVPADDAGQIGAILLHPNSVIAREKYDYIKLFSPGSDSRVGSAYLYQNRKYQDLFVLAQRVPGIAINATKGSVSSL